MYSYDCNCGSCDPNQDDWADYYSAYEPVTFESEAKKVTKQFAKGLISERDLALKMCELTLKYES